MEQQSLTASAAAEMRQQVVDCRLAVPLSWALLDQGLSPLFPPLAEIEYQDLPSTSASSEMTFLKLGDLKV